MKLQKYHIQLRQKHCQMKVQVLKKYLRRSVIEGWNWNKKSLRFQQSSKLEIRRLERQNTATSIWVAGLGTSRYGLRFGSAFMYFGMSFELFWVTRWGYFFERFLCLLFEDCVASFRIENLDSIANNFLETREFLMSLLQLLIFRSTLTTMQEENVKFRELLDSRIGMTSTG